MMNFGLRNVPATFQLLENSVVAFGALSPSLPPFEALLSPVLAGLQLNRQFKLQVDASQVGAGAVCQRY